MGRLAHVLSHEFAGLHLRLLLAKVLINLLPPHVGNQLRVYLLRLAGFRIGRGTVMWGAPKLVGDKALYDKLTIGEACWINVGCLLELGGKITIGDCVALGQQVMIITTTHDIGTAVRRAGPRQTKAVSIGNGAWICSRATILPGVTIGAGAVVAAGAVVTKSVAPNLLVGGVPARVLRELPADEEERTAVLSEVEALVSGLQY
jgi:maltose O-acetyltransferase